MEQYPVLNLITRHGLVAAIAMAVFAGILSLWLLYGPLGWLAAIIALLIGGVAFVIAKSYVELVVLITEMLVPR
jgi:hypothetical protein